MPDSPTADLYDEHGENLQSCDLQLRQYGGTRAFGGTIATIKSFEDNALVREAVREPGAGRVLVIDGSGSLHAALLGDQLARLALDSRYLIPAGGDVLEGQTTVVHLHDVAPLHPPASHREPQHHQEGGGEQEIPEMSSGVERDHHREEEKKRKP